MSLTYSHSRVAVRAVRDSLDDDEVSDDVEDEVFIRDGRNGLRLDDEDERGVKRPLMAPRRKLKSGHFHSEVCRGRACRLLCVPCCYGLLAMAGLLGVIMLVVLLIMWFPLPLEQMAFWRVAPTASLLVPCTSMETEDVWVTSLPKLTSESALQLNDVNGDGVPDVILGYGTGADGWDVPDFVCTLYFNGVTPCMGGLLALDGRTGRTLWQHWTPHAVYTVDCGADLTGDHIMDCLATGRGGVLRVVNGHDGSLVWQLERPAFPDGEPQVDVYAGLFIHDVDGDGVQDVLATHTEETGTGDSGPTLCGHLVLISGHNGRVLQRVTTPNGEESYYPPQLLVRIDGELLILFGTGGHASPGGLYVLPLQQLAIGSVQQVTAVHRDLFKGIMSAPALVDLDRDGSEDIVVSSFNSSVLAFDGRTFQLLWNYSFPASETYSVPTPGYFNDDDIPDILVKYQTGPGSPVYYYTQTTVLDGRTGVPLLDRMMIDGAGSQSAGLSISMEGAGNDFFLHWQADCKGHEGAQDPYAFWSGDTVRARSRADICRLRYNSSLVTHLLALSQHVQPPGVVIYSSEQRKAVEYENAMNASAEVRRYLDEHPDFWDIYGGSPSSPEGYDKEEQLQPDKKKLNAEEGGEAGSIFHHKEEQPKASDYYYAGQEYSVPDRGRNRNPPGHLFPGVGEEEEVLPVFPGNSEYPDVRKHGTKFAKHPTTEEQRQWQSVDYSPGESDPIANPGADTNPMSGMFDNSVPNTDPDYDVLYNPSGEDGYRSQQGQRDERKAGTGARRFKGDRRGQRRKREVTVTGSKGVSGIQRLTSAGVLVPSIGNPRNDSIDVIFATYWIPPSHGSHLLLSKDLECMQRTHKHSKQATDKYPAADSRCQQLRMQISEHLKVAQAAQTDTDPFALDMGQMTVYRLRLSCQCDGMTALERCPTVLPFSRQSWPAATGYFRARFP